MQDSDYLGDGEGAATATDDSAQSSDDTGQTAVIPTELCPGMKVGDTIALKIVGVDDDSYEVAYKPDEQHEEDMEAAPAPAPDPMME
jgi:hypothetical protein